MITKTEVETAIAKTGVERYRLLCFRSPDLRTRANWQALVIQTAAGWTGGQEHPPIDLIRQTPSGQRIPPDESALIQCKKCGGGACELEPVAMVGPDGFLIEEAV